MKDKKRVKMFYLFDTPLRLLMGEEIKKISTFNWKKELQFQPFLPSFVRESQIFLSLPLVARILSRCKSSFELSLHPNLLLARVPVSSLCISAKKKKRKSANRSFSHTLPLHSLLEPSIEICALVLHYSRSSLRDKAAGALFR